MNDILLTELKSVNTELINQISRWYNEEWGIGIEATKKKLQTICASNTQTQVILLANGQLIATGGVYHHVGLLNHVPRLKQHQYWLALVYTAPQYRKMGYGIKLCSYLQNIYNNMGVEKLYLFTHTAESMYQKLGWKLSEKIKLAEREISVMYIKLH